MSSSHTFWKQPSDRQTDTATDVGTGASTDKDKDIGTSTHLEVAVQRLHDAVDELKDAQACNVSHMPQQSHAIAATCGIA